MKNATPPAERHLNLVIALMNATQPLTRRDIQTTVAGYDPHADPKSFERMFERDKEMLRELGVPIITVEGALSHASELGYRIDKDQFALGELELEPSEIGLLSLATRLWQDTALESESQRGLTKLKSHAASVDSAILAGFDPRLGHDSPALEPILDAVTQRQHITFEYRTGDTGTRAMRTLAPWAVLARASGWYVAGWDTDKHSKRVFKLNRITSDITKVGSTGSYDIPADMSFGSMLGALHGDAASAHLAVKKNSAHVLRMRATASQLPVPAGYDSVEVAFRDLVDIADELAGYADSVLVMSPQHLQSEVISRLRDAEKFGQREPSESASQEAETHG